jgi:hypothetical protein
VERCVLPEAFEIMLLTVADYRHVKNPKRFFKEGKVSFPIPAYGHATEPYMKVFHALWNDSYYDGDDRSVHSKALTTNSYGEFVYSKTRRFVVIRTGHHYCLALPVTTYGFQGVAKRGVVKADHAIIYTGRTVPPITPAEYPLPHEAGMRLYPIRVDPDVPETKLDPMSRIDFAKAHPIDTRTKVKSFGKVNNASMGALVSQWQAVMMGNIATMRWLQPVPEAPVANRDPVSREAQCQAFQTLSAVGWSSSQITDILAGRDPQGMAQQRALAGTCDADDDSDDGEDEECSKDGDEASSPE